MSLVNVLNVEVLQNPSAFAAPLLFEITFECLAHLDEDLNWKLVYVGSAETEQYDQVLDSIMVGPVPVGINKFVFEADAPNPELIPSTEIRGVTVLLLVCSYLDQEFIRIGYYVDNDYESPELREAPPETLQLGLLRRNILSDKPRVTRFNIVWDSAKCNGLAEDIPEELMNLKEDDEPEDDEDSEDEEEDDSEESGAEARSVSLSSDGEDEKFGPKDNNMCDEDGREPVFTPGREDEDSDEYMSSTENSSSHQESSSSSSSGSACLRCPASAGPSLVSMETDVS